MWMLSSNCKHLLVTLLSLDFIVFMLYIILYNYLNSFNYELFLSMAFLTFSFCEGALGFSMLVTKIRSYDNEYFQTYSKL